ncbi:MAG: hypothetical protein GX787_02895 [Tissierellia bacterium]|jgi:phage-related tail protein|nr:hypothetical protein [Tissierellia bacterium]
MEKIKLSDLTWEGNSKKMYDEIIDSLPPMFKAAVNKKFEVWANQKGESNIKEWNIKHTLEKYAPPKYQDMFMPIYEKHKTD